MAQQAAAHQVRQHRFARLRPEQRQVGMGQRQLGGRAAQVWSEDVGVGRVGHGGLHRPTEYGVGVVHQVGVQRVVPGDEDRQCLLSGAARAARLLPDRGQRAGIAGQDDGVQAGDVHAQLEGVGRRYPEQGPRLQPRLQVAALLGEVARPVRRQPTEQRRVHLGDRPLGGQRGHFRAPPGAHERQRSCALDHQVGQDVRSFGQRGASHRGTVLAGQVGQRWLPEGELGGSTRRRVVGDLDYVEPGQPGRRLGWPGHRRRGEHEGRIGAVPGTDPAQPPQHMGHMRAEHAPVPVALVHHDVPQSAQEPRPPAVPGEYAAVQHVGIGQHQVGVGAHPVPLRGRGVPVVGRGPHLGQRQPADAAQLVAGQRLGRGEVERRGPLAGDHGREHGQQVGQRLPRRRPGGHHHRCAGVRQFGGGGLVRPGRQHAASPQPVDDQLGHPVRPGGRASGPSRHPFEVGDPLPSARGRGEPVEQYRRG